MKDKLKKYNITMEIISKWFELSSVKVLHSSSAKKKYIRVTERILEHVLSEIRQKLE